MSSANFFTTGHLSTTFGPGLHTLELRAQQSASAQSWNTPRAAICLQALYTRLWAREGDVQSWLHYDGNVYSLGRGVPLPSFMNEVEAKYRDVTVLATKANARGEVEMAVLHGECEEELVPGSQNRGCASQFAWAFRLYFPKCRRERGFIPRVLP